MRWRRVFAVFWKDFLDLRKNKALVASMMALPAVLVVVPAAVVWQILRDPDSANWRVTATYYDPNFALGMDAARFMLDKTLTDLFGLFLVMPVFVPILVSSQSVAGEKERRTLEPLLASPISSAELVIGKSLASMVPAVGISWAAFAVFCAVIDGVAVHFSQPLLMPNAMWLFGVIVIAPLFAFFGNGIAVTISAYVGEARTAQQISGLFVLPLVGLVGAQVAGFLKAGAVFYAIQGGVILLADIALVIIAVRLFDRERLISRWT